MPFSLHRLARPVEETYQVKLKVANTFFALTLASYFVLVHHCPKVFRWDLGHTLYEVKSEDIVKSETSITKRLPWRGSIEAAATQEFITYPIDLKTPGLLLPFQGFARTELGGVVAPRISMPTRSSGQEKPLFFNEKQAFSSPRMTLNDEFLGLKENQNAIFGQANQFIPPQSTPPSPQKPILPVSSHQLIQTAGNESTEELFLSEQPFEAHQKIKQGTKGHVSNLLQHVSKVIPVNIQVLLKKENFPARNTNNATSDVISSLSQTPFEKESLLTWNKLDPRELLLIEWLRKLESAKRNISKEDIPFLEAFERTALSPEFRPSININWEEDDDEPRKKLRKKFHHRYMTNIEWSKTPYKVSSHEEAFYYSNWDGYVPAYQFPQKIGINAYKDSDIDCKLN